MTEDERYAAEMGHPVPVCPVCRVPMIGRDGRFGMFWACPKWPRCDVTCSYRNGELSPPANKATRQARSRLFNLIGMVEERFGVPRRDIYQWLLEASTVEPELLRIANFTAEQCSHFEQVIADKLGGLPEPEETPVQTSRSRRIVTRPGEEKRYDV